MGRQAHRPKFILCPGYELTQLSSFDVSQFSSRHFHLPEPNNASMCQCFFSNCNAHVTVEIYQRAGAEKNLSRLFFLAILQGLPHSNQIFRRSRRCHDPGSPSFDFPKRCSTVECAKNLHLISDELFYRANFGGRRWVFELQVSGARYFCADSSDERWGKIWVVALRLVLNNYWD